MIDPTSQSAGDPSADPTAGAQAGQQQQGDPNAQPGAGQQQQTVVQTPAGPVTFTPEQLKALSIQDLAKHYGRDLFDQDRVNSFVTDRLGRERRTAQNLIEQLQNQYNQKLQEIQEAAQGGGQNAQVSIADRQALQGIQEQMEDMQLVQELNRLDRRYKDFGQNVNEIMQVALNDGLSPENAYRVWKYDSVSGIDLADIEKRAVDRYVKGKTTTARTTPVPQGQGGTAPATAPEHDGSFDTAGKRGMARLLAPNP